MIRRVALLHGIWNATLWLNPLATRLRDAGFEIDLFGYDSVFGAPEATLPGLIERLGSRGADAIVGHSLGGLMALEALRLQPGLPVRRVVCLGSPLLGSTTARSIASRSWGAPVLGRSAQLLQRGLGRWDGNAQVGMVAGNVAMGVGTLLSALDGASDGTVTVAETRLPGLADHCIVASSHSGLVFSAQAALQAAAFLRKGRFEA